MVFGISRHHELSGCRALSRAPELYNQKCSNALQWILQLSLGTHLADQQDRGRGGARKA